MERRTVPLTKVKEKFQVTIPTEVRKTARLAVGDILEATVKNNVIVLKPKVVVDRHPEINARLREALEDVKAGRVSKTFHSVEELMADLNNTSKGKKRRTEKTL